MPVRLREVLMASEVGPLGACPDARRNWAEETTGKAVMSGEKAFPMLGVAHTCLLDLAATGHLACGRVSDCRAQPMSRGGR